MRSCVAELFSVNLVVPHYLDRMGFGELSPNLRRVPSRSPRERHLEKAQP